MKQPNPYWLRILHHKADGTTDTYTASTFEFSQGVLHFTRQREFGRACTMEAYKDELLSTTICLDRGEKVECFAINFIEMLYGKGEQGA